MYDLHLIFLGLLFVSQYTKQTPRVCLTSALVSPAANINPDLMYYVCRLCLLTLEVRQRQCVIESCNIGKLFFSLEMWGGTGDFSVETRAERGELA